MLSEGSGEIVENRPIKQAVSSQKTGGIRLEELEERLRSVLIYNWIKLRVLSEHNIAIGWYQNHKKEPHSTTVIIFTITKEPWMEGRGLSITEMEGVTRTFRKRQRKIAKWYYKELCQLFKDGIYVVSGSKKTSLGRWD